MRSKSVARKFAQGKKKILCNKKNINYNIMKKKRNP